ncbi:MAG TPA: OsmC family protein [Promineifilum sp.]|nr:OsmC family protein [Promineifilum sp.]
MDAIITLQDEMHFTALPTSGQLVHMDSKPSETGLRQGASPMELLLSALGGCTAMDVISILRKKRQAVTGFEVRVHGERTTEHPQVFTDITIEYVVRGVNIDPAAVARSIELSTETYCSVHAMLHQAANIRTAYTIVQE